MCVSCLNCLQPLVRLPVADPGFPRGCCANQKGGDAHLLFWSIFPKKAWKWQKWDPRGEELVPWRPPESTNGYLLDPQQLDFVMTWKSDELRRTHLNKLFSVCGISETLWQKCVGLALSPSPPSPPPPWRWPPCGEFWILSVLCFWAIMPGCCCDVC